MARPDSVIAARFLRKFEKDRPIHDMAAQQATELLKEVLVNSPALIHVVAARCKKTDSFLAEALREALRPAKTTAN